MSFAGCVEEVAGPPLNKPEVGALVALAVMSKLSVPGHVVDTVPSESENENGEGVEPAGIALPLAGSPKPIFCTVEGPEQVPLTVIDSACNPSLCSASAVKLMTSEPLTVMLVGPLSELVFVNRLTLPAGLRCSTVNRGRGHRSAGGPLGDPLRFRQ